MEGRGRVEAWLLPLDAGHNICLKNEKRDWRLGRVLVPKKSTGCRPWQALEAMHGLGQIHPEISDEHIWSRIVGI